MAMSKYHNDLLKWTPKVDFLKDLEDEKFQWNRIKNGPKNHETKKKEMPRNGQNSSLKRGYGSYKRRM